MGSSMLKKLAKKIKAFWRKDYRCAEVEYKGRRFLEEFWTNRLGEKMASVSEIRRETVRKYPFSSEFVTKERIDPIDKVWAPSGRVEWANLHIAWYVRRLEEVQKDEDKIEELCGKGSCHHDS